MAIVNINDWDKKNTASVGTLSDGSSFTGLNKVQPIKISEGTGSGTGDAQFSSSTWDNITAEDDIVVTELDESATRAYEIESLDTTNREAWIWVYGSWDSDDSDQVVIAAGGGDGSNYSSGGTGSNPWGETGVNAELMYLLADSTDSTGNSTATVSGASQNSTGQLDGSYTFDGTDDYIETDDSSDYSSGFTAVAWFNTGDGSQELQRVINKEETGSNSLWRLLLNDTTSSGNLNLRFDLFADSSITVESSDLSAGTWYRAVAIFDGATAELYIDAVSQGTANTSNFNADDEPFAIGASSSTHEQHFDGKIDTAGLLSEVKSGNWVQADFDASPKGGQTFFTWSGPENTLSFNGATTTANASGTGETVSLSGSTTASTNAANATASGDTIFIEPDFATLSATANASGDTISISGQTTVMIAETADASGTGSTDLDLKPNLLLGQGASASASGNTIGTDRLQGNVDVEGQPTVGVDVNIVDKTNNVLYETVTDSNGDWIVDAGGGAVYQVAYLFDDGTTYYGDAEESDTT